MKQEIIDKAKAGDIEAMFRLAGHLYAGKSVNQSYSLARQWYEAAAEKGHGMATYELALMYQEGLGGEKNGEKAAEFFIKAAECGVDDAKFELGVMYANGNGVKKNYVKAMKYLRDARTYAATAFLNEAPKWWEAAAKQGIAEAEYQFGLCYINGYGLPQDYVSGRYWMLRAAKQNSAKAFDALSQIYQFGLGVSKSEESMKYFRKRYCDIKGHDYEKFGVSGGETIAESELDYEKIDLPVYAAASEQSQPAPVEILGTPLMTGKIKENKKK